MLLLALFNLTMCSRRATGCEKGCKVRHPTRWTSHALGRRSDRASPEPEPRSDPACPKKQPMPARPPDRHPSQEIPRRALFFLHPPTCTRIRFQKDQMYGPYYDERWDHDRFDDGRETEGWGHGRRDSREREWASAREDRKAGEEGEGWGR